MTTAQIVCALVVAFAAGAVVGVLLSGVFVFRSPKAKTAKPSALRDMDEEE